MKLIYQYLIRSDAILELWKDAEILTVAAVEDSHIFLYVLTEPGKEKIIRRFKTVKTSSDGAPENGIYIGTCLIRGIGFHTFEIAP